MLTPVFETNGNNVSYSATDENGNAIDLTDEETYGTKYKTKSYAKDTTVTVENKLSKDGYTNDTANDKTYDAVTGQSHSIIANPFTRTGYTFAGWQLVSPATGYATSGSITVNENVTYKATWTVNKHDVKYELTGTDQPSVTLPATKKNVEYGAEFTDIAAKLTATGYTFSGWKVRSGDVPASDITNDTDGNVTKFTMPDKPNYTGYRFEGWNSSDADVSGTTFSMPDKNVTITGVFTKDSTPDYTLIYNCNTDTYTDLTGLTGAPSDANLTAASFTDGQYQLTTAYPDSDNFRFVCWSRTKNYSVANIVEKVAVSDFNAENKCEVYAIWVDSDGKIIPSPGTGESDMPMMLALNMALLAMLAAGFVLMNQYNRRRETAN